MTHFNLSHCYLLTFVTYEFYVDVPRPRSFYEFQESFILIESVIQLLRTSRAKNKMVQFILLHIQIWHHLYTATYLAKTKSGGRYSIHISIIIHIRMYMSRTIVHTCMHHICTYICMVKLPSCHNQADNATSSRILINLIDILVVDSEPLGSTFNGVFVTFTNVMVWREKFLLD